MKIIKTLVIVASLFLFKTDSAKEYYFQLPDLTDSIIFKYECKEDPSKTEYWKLTSDTKKNTLITEAYNSDFEKYEFFQEEFTESGSKVLMFVSYHKNENGELDVAERTIKESDVFKWDKNTDYHYSAVYNDLNYGKVSFSKYRTFVKEVVISILGANKSVLKFKGQYKTKIPSEDYDYEYSQFSYYAKGIGLVKMEKIYPFSINVTLELTEIISKEDWDKMQ